MPELPEVEIYRRNLERWWEGKAVESVELVREATVKEGDLQDIVGVVPSAFVRRGKFLTVHFESIDASLVFHFRLTGKVVLLEDGDDRSARVIIALEDGTRMGYLDKRNLGHLHLIPTSRYATFPTLKTMGPEPWPEAIDGATLRGRFARTGQPIKVALLDQKRVAGVGNIVASEALFAARIDPRAPAKSLPLETFSALAEAIRDVCQLTVEAEDGKEIIYVNEPGSDQAHFVIYGREGEPCARCETPIVRLIQATRSTFYCPSCQTP